MGAPTPCLLLPAPFSAATRTSRPNFLAASGSLPSTVGWWAPRPAPPRPAFLAGSQIHEKPYPCRMGSQQLAGRGWVLRGFRSHWGWG